MACVLSIKSNLQSVPVSDPPPLPNMRIAAAVSIVLCCTAGSYLQPSSHSRAAGSGQHLFKQQGPPMEDCVRHTGEVSFCDHSIFCRLPQWHSRTTYAALAAAALSGMPANAARHGCMKLVLCLSGRCLCISNVWLARGRPCFIHLAALAAAGAAATNQTVAAAAPDACIAMLTKWPCPLQAQAGPFPVPPRVLASP